MMKRFLFLLAFIPGILSAQGTNDRTALVINGLDAVWSSSSNAAGLVLSPYSAFNVLDLRYAWQGGDYRPMQTGTDVSLFRFDTQGARQIGKVQVWGQFRYSNDTDKGSSYNTLLFDPFDERFMYTAADTVAGIWKRQSYEMQFKAAIPITPSLAAGLHVKYTDRIAAGQVDPRAELYHYSVLVKPAVAWKGGFGSLGLNGLYTNTFERTTPSISNTQVNQKVFLLKGLGNWVGEQVGGGGLGTMYFRCDSWGGALQYAYEGNWKLFSELSWTHHSTRTTETPTQPKLHGKTLRDEFMVSAGARFGGNGILHRISAEASLARTRGIEPTVIWNTAAGIWEVKTELEQCLFRTVSASLEYHGYKTEGDGYKAHWYAVLGFEDKADSYASPASMYFYDNIPLQLGAEGNFSAGPGSLLLGASVRGSKNLRAGYSYSGHRAGTAPVRELYPHNLAVFSADRLQLSLSAEYAFPVSKGTSLAFCIEGTGLGALCGDYGNLYRIFADGAVKLYF